MGSNGIDDISVQLNANYIEQIREIRLKQIIKHADELVKTVESEADELDEEDLLEILASIRDYETYRQRLEEYSDISSIVQYWPSILLPAPAYAVRLDSKHQRPLILQLQA
jgi:polyribonucleotide nucleotidyltransferase